MTARLLNSARQYATLSEEDIVALRSAKLVLYNNRKLNDRLYAKVAENIEIMNWQFAEEVVTDGAILWAMNDFDSFQVCSRRALAFFYLG